MMQKPCQDSYYTLFSSYTMLLDYHEEQAKNSRWIRCKVADLQVEPLGESSPLIGNLSAFAAGTSQEAVKDTAENLGLAMRVNGELYPVRMTAYKSLLDRAKIGGTALPKLSREVLAEVLNECLKLYSADALLLIRDEKISAVHSGDEVDYSVLPIDELLKVLQAKLDARFSGNEFESGYCDHSLVSASWRIFKGHLRCGECGQAMFLRNKKNHAGERVPWYYCSLHENYNSSYCVKKAVKKQDVEDIALKLIRTQIKLFTDARELLAALNKKESSKTKFRIYSDQIRGVKKQIDRYVSLKASLYEEFANGTLSQNDYISMGQEYAAKADELRIFLAELEKECQKYNPSFAASGSWAELIEQYKDADTLTAEMVDAFIDEMILYNNGHVEVKFNFRNELDEVIHLAAIRQREVERYAM